MKISPQWLREFVNIKADDERLAQDLTQAGIAVESVSGEGPQTIFEMDITTNRVDAMNHHGVARECSASYDIDLKPIAPKLPAPKNKPEFQIEIEDPHGCARYTARIIHGLKIAPSPPNIRTRLEIMDVSSINNAVDASNYALIEMGHPTHAFDIDLLEGEKIIVRKARSGETLKTLDGIERKLHPEDLVIADAKKPVALAGVMGGFDSMITEKTKNILIESAWFDPITIRKTARRHGMHTDASHRFERGADWGATSLACARVAELILQSAGGELTGGEMDVIARKLNRPAVKLNRSELLRILGQEIPASDVERILRRLGFTLTQDRASAECHNDYIVALPTWRLDVESEIDLLEEIARIYGYNSFKSTMPSFAGAVVELPEAHEDAKLRSTLLALGYDEAISTTFISAADARQFSAAPAVQLANPLNEEAAVMRNSLVPGMLNMLAHNLHRGSNDLRLFEAAHVYELAGGQTEERKQICMGACGHASTVNVHVPQRQYSFFDLKGDVETLLSAFEHSSLYFDENAGDYYHPGRSARVVMEGVTVARLGQIQPEIAAARKIKQEVYIAEILLDRLYRDSLRQPKYEPPSRFPAVERDFSFIFPDAVTFKQISEAIADLKFTELRNFQPADRLRGKEAERAGISGGNYSMLLRANFQSLERTLRDDEVAAWSAQIIAALEKLGGRLRS